MSFVSDIFNPYPSEAYRQAAKSDIARGIPIHSTFGSFQQLTQVLPIQDNEIDLDSINTKEPKYGKLKYGGIDD